MNTGELQQALDRMIDHAMGTVVTEIATLTPAQRARFVELLNKRFCIHCGEDYRYTYGPDKVGQCYCRRDD